MKGVVNHMRGTGKRAWAACMALTGLMCLAFLLPHGVASAAGKGPLDEPAAYLIKLNKDPKGGKTAYLSGTATPSGANLKLKGLWATQAVKLVVMPEDKNKVIHVELRKYHWKKPLRTGSTAGSGECGLAFTNQGDVFIKLISPKGPAKVYLAVKVADSPTPQMKPVLVPKGAKP